MYALIFLFVTSVAINLYKLPDHLFFSHEQGRDAQAAKGIYSLKDFTLIGPKTEIPGVFTPPWYYYLVAIPYGLSGGNAQIASIIQTIFISTTAPIIYLLARNLLQSNHWALVAGIFSAFSFEFISYSRWLTNVSPAIPTAASAFYFFVAYHQTSKQKYLTLFAVLAISASVFQIVLVFQFLLVWAVLTILKNIKPPQAKTAFVITIFAIVAASPLILFDFRNQHITTNAISDFLRGTADYPARFDPFGSLSLYFKEILTIFKRTLFNFNHPALLLLAASVLLFGLLLTAASQKRRPPIILAAVMSLMGLGIFIFNIGLTQLYLTTGIGLILLFTISVRSLWENPKTRILAIAISVLWLVSLGKNLTYLDRNQGMFFQTIAEGLNYKDQKAILNFIRTDAKDQEYRLEAYTIPYLKPQGWEYLHQYFFGELDNKTARLTYIIIEKNVQDFWRQKWTQEMGPSKIILVAKFNDIRLEKRILK